MSEVAAPINRLVFDGDCAFCSTCARWFEARLVGNELVVAWQMCDIDELGLSLDDVATAAWWIEADGTRSRGHAAVSEALSSIGGMWSPVGFLMRHRPTSWVAGAVYALVAKYRHRLPGGTPACRLGP